MNGKSQWITGEAARNDGHHWRARACAVLTGIGTVRDDDPQLTVRAVATPRQPLRVVVDSRLEMPTGARILEGGGVLIACAVADKAKAARLRDAGAEIVVIPNATGKVDLPALMQELGRRGINELHIEAGHKLNGSLLDEDCVDELLLYLAPCLIGDRARGMVDLPELADLAARRNLKIDEYAHGRRRYPHPRRVGGALAMFTGIIEAVGRVREVKPAAGGVRIAVDTGALDLADVKIGDSIAVDGVCLTVVAHAGKQLEFDVSRETLACTAGFMQGAHVNLEKSLRLADRLGGHLVSGHVDGIGSVVRFDAVGDNRRLVVDAPREIAKYIARKGSIAVNGVSLTVNAVEGARFEINLIPHTLAATNLRALTIATKVNVEVDLLARYAERLFEFKDKSP